MKKRVYFGGAFLDTVALKNIFLVSSIIRLYVSLRLLKIFSLPFGGPRVSVRRLSFVHYFCTYQTKLGFNYDLSSVFCSCSLLQFRINVF